MDSNAGVVGEAGCCELTVLDRGRHQLRIESPWKLFGPVINNEDQLKLAAFDNLPTYYLSNSTAGLLAGDHLAVNVKLMPGTGAKIIVPAATKVFSMREGCAAQNLRFAVGTAATLFYYGNQLIPYTRSNYIQNADYHLETGASLVAMEFLTPGRMAGGEVFAFERLRLRSRIFLNRNLILDDRLFVNPNATGGELIAQPGALDPGRPVIGTLYLAGRIVAEVTKLDALERQPGLGFTAPAPELIVGRAAAATVQEAEKALKMIFVH
jgi:urease accessory protein UreH